MEHFTSVYNFLFEIISIKLLAGRKIRTLASGDEFKIIMSALTFSLPESMMGLRLSSSLNSLFLTGDLNWKKQMTLDEMKNVFQNNLFGNFYCFEHFFYTHVYWGRRRHVVFIDDGCHSWRWETEEWSKVLFNIFF